MNFKQKSQWFNGLLYAEEVGSIEASIQLQQHELEIKAVRNDKA